MKRVLVPIDATPHSLEGLRGALREANVIEHIHLLNVQPRFHRHIARWTSRAARDGWRAERAQAALGPALRLLHGGNIPWTAHAESGPVGETIAATARRLRCDEIVMGAARRGPLGRLIANSVTAQLLERSTVPVRVIPGPAAPRFERLALPAGLGLIALLFLADE
jgi:nucleotide-binding universal stress UspA family protein